MLSLLAALTLLADPTPRLPKLDAVAGPKNARAELKVYRALEELPENARAVAAGVDFEHFMLATLDSGAIPVLGTVKTTETDGGWVLELPSPPSPCPPCTGINQREWTPSVQRLHAVEGPPPSLFLVPRSPAKVFARAQPVDVGRPCKPCLAQ